MKVSVPGSKGKTRLIGELPALGMTVNSSLWRAGGEQAIVVLLLEERRIVVSYLEWTVAG